MPATILSIRTQRSRHRCITSLHAASITFDVSGRVSHTPSSDCSTDKQALPSSVELTWIYMSGHWLPVKQRALYKLALITFNVLQHNNPMYLRDLLTTHNPSRNLHSSSQHLSVGYMRTVLSSRCFKHSAALNWNDLPYDIRACYSVNVFKRKLKTHLFNIAYPT